MQCLTPLIAPLATLSGADSSVTDGAPTPSATVGALVWSAAAHRMMFFTGTNWSSGAMPMDIAAGTSYDISTNTQMMSPTTITIEGTLFVEGTVAFL